MPAVYTQQAFLLITYKSIYYATPFYLELFFVYLQVDLK